jgi:uncharacterized protein
MELWANPVFLTLVFTSIGAQLVKIAIFYIKSRKVHTLDLVATGGMPSSHSALTIGLCTIIYLTEGATTAFMIALAVASIVIVDAMGVRRTAGEEGRIVHLLIKKTKLKIRAPHVSFGHTPAQVLVGSLFGFVVAFFIYVII